MELTMSEIRSGRSPWQRLRCIDVDFAVLIVLMVLNHLPVLHRRVVPVEDSLYSFDMFAYFYSEFVTTGDIARWLPYGMYGVPASFDQAICLSPMCYLAGLLGALAGCRDTVLLFKLAILGEKGLFLSGLYLLSKRIYSTRLCRLLVGTAAIFTMSWFTQLWWDWRIYYMLPWMFYFLVLFTERQDPFWFWVTGITALGTLLGSLIYFAPVLLFLLTVFGCCLAWEQPRALRSLFTLSWPAGLALLVFLAFAGAYGWQVYHCLDDVALMVFARDSQSGRVAMEFFLTYGDSTISQLLSGYLTGWPPYADNTHYIGLLPLLCALWGMLHLRTPLFWAFLITAFSLIFLSFGGVTTRLVYYFPLMSLFRHIGLVYGPVRLLLLLCGGFGLDRLVRWISAWRKGAQPPSFCYLPAVLLAAWLPLELRAGSALHGLFERWDAGVLEEPSASPSICTFRPGLLDSWDAWALTPSDVHLFLLAVRSLLYLASALILYALVRRGCLRLPRWRVVAAAGLCLVLLADVGSFRLLTHLTMPQLIKAGASDLQSYRARPLAFCESRQEVPADPVADRALHQYEKRRRCKYTMAYNFLQFDPPWPRFRTDQISRRAHQLLLARGGKPAQYDHEAFLPRHDYWLLNALGCSGGKLQLRTDVISAPGKDDEGLEQIRGLAADSSALVLGQPKVAGLEDPSPRAYHITEGTVEVLHFSANALVVKATNTVGADAWLYYADSWHEDWRCTVNGRPAPVARANHAFKAVRLGSGESTVRFSFDGGARYGVSYALAVLGLLFALAGCAGALWILCWRCFTASAAGKPS
jgi:hypothetical protein